MNALFYLLVCQWKGAVRNLLRSGFRTLMGLLALVYFGAGAFQGLFLSRRALPFPVRLDPRLMGSVEAGLLFFLAVPALGIAAQGLRGKAVAFTAGDVDFLFSMPIPQRWVLGFRLALDSLQILGAVLLAGFWLSPILTEFLGAPLSALLRIGIPAVFLCLLFIHSVSHAVYLFYAYRVRVSEILDAAVKFAGIGILVAVILAALYDASLGETPWDQFLRFLHYPVVRAALFPVRLATDAILSANRSFPNVAARNIGILAALAAAGIAAALGQRTNLYEPSLSVSLRRSRLREAIRSGGAQGLRAELLRERADRPAGGFTAPVLGPGWKALIWKSLQSWFHAPWFGLGFGAFVSVGVPVLLDHYLPPDNRMPVAFATPLAWAYFIFIIGVSQIQRMRGELVHGEYLKTLPIPAWKIIASLLATPIALFTLVFWGNLLAMGVLFRDVYQPVLPVLALIGPALLAAMSAFHSWAALLYPRQRDPLQKTLTGLLLLPGWGLLFFAPLAVAGASVAFLYRRFQGPHLYEAPNAGLTNRLLISVGSGLFFYYVAVFLLFLWWGGLAFRAYSPSEE
jgi:hypothetical protein